MESNINIVIVQYGNEHSSAISDLLAWIRTKFSCSVHVIRTDIKIDGKFVQDLNEAMEFSGYQEGLLRVLDDTHSEFERIIFLNDTAVSTHFLFYTRSLLRQLIFQLSSVSEKESFFFGCSVPLPKSFCRDNVVEYMSTWIFSLSSTASNLKHFKFYSLYENFYNFSTHTMPYLPSKYKDDVRHWLEPTSWLKGWHKSIPNRRLPAEVFIRKSMAIYLEHSLPHRCSENRISSRDVLANAPFLSRMNLILLQVVDRIIINLQKLKYRANIKFYECFKLNN